MAKTNIWYELGFWLFAVPARLIGRLIYRRVN